MKESDTSTWLGSPRVMYSYCTHRSRNRLVASKAGRSSTTPQPREQQGWLARIAAFTSTTRNTVLGTNQGLVHQMQAWSPARIMSCRPALLFTDWTLSFCSARRDAYPVRFTRFGTQLTNFNLVLPKVGSRLYF
jgi:hypothetical protein